MADAEGWRLLGQRVKLERSRHRAWRRRADFAAACGLGERTIAALENTERTNFSADVISAVESTLGWEVGDAERVRNGMEPNRRHDPRLSRLLEIWPSLTPDAQRLLVEFAERARDT